MNSKDKKEFASRLFKAGYCKDSYQKICALVDELDLELVHEEPDWEDMFPSLEKDFTIKNICV